MKAWGAGSLPKELLKASELALNVASQGIPTAASKKPVIGLRKDFRVIGIVGISLA